MWTLPEADQSWRRDDDGDATVTAIDEMERRRHSFCRDPHGRVSARGGANGLRARRDTGCRDGRTDAMVRVVHASPDAPDVDVLVDGERAVEGLPFGEATDFLALPAGDYQVQVVPAGAEAEDAVIDADLTLEGGVAYQVAAVGLVAEIEAAVFEVDMEPVADEMARVRVIHASPDAGAVDVAVTGGPVLFEGAEFPNATDYAEVDATTYDLEVRAAGTEDVALEVPGVELEAGMVYDIFAIGLAEDGSLTVLPLTASPDGDDSMATPEA